MIVNFEKLAGPVVRRIVSATTLLAYLMAAIGFPVPESSASSSSANTCGRRVCCCGSEAQCRASGCGCSHSTLQPPALPPTGEPGRGSSDETDNSDIEPSKCCKSTQSLPPSLQPSRIKEFAISAQPAMDNNATSSPKGTSISWLVGMSALKCQGGSTSWLALNAATVFTPRFCWHVDCPYCHSLPVIHHVPFVESGEPVDPPPRPVDI